VVLEAAPANLEAAPDRPALAVEATTIEDRREPGAGSAATPGVAATPRSTAAASSPSAAAAARPARIDQERAARLLAIEATRVAGGEELVLRADAPFRRQDVFAALIGPDPPRYLLRLTGIEHPWRPPDIEVGSPLIQRVRTGIHDTPRGRQLHIVMDLTSRALEHDWEIDGAVLRVRLRPKTP
jgi:hypothetical protein